MCIKNLKLCCYFNYYNFTLKKAIDKKKTTATRFTESELWYVFYTLFDLGKFLQSENISIGDYRTSRVFLSPEGYLKLYLLHIYPQNKHNPYFSVLGSREDIDKYLLSPQQLRSIQMNQYEIGFDVYKSDIFCIGMMILELIFLDDPKFYYYFEQLEVNFGRIKYNLASLKGEYSEEFQKLLMSCLQQNPLQRVDFEQGLAYIESIRNGISIAGCIKLVEEEDDPKRKRTQNRFTTGNPSIKGLPGGIDQRLMVTPITTLSDKKQTLLDSSNQSIRNSGMKKVNHQPF